MKEGKRIMKKKNFHIKTNDIFNIESIPKIEIKEIKTGKKRITNMMLSNFEGSSLYLNPLARKCQKLSRNNSLLLSQESKENNQETRKDNNSQLKDNDSKQNISKYVVTEITSNHDDNQKLLYKRSKSISNQIELPKIRKVKIGGAYSRNQGEQKMPGSLLIQTNELQIPANEKVISSNTNLADLNQHSSDYYTQNDHQSKFKRFNLNSEIPNYLNTADQGSTNPTLSNIYKINNSQQNRKQAENIIQNNLNKDLLRLENNINNYQNDVKEDQIGNKHNLSINESVENKYSNSNRSLAKNAQPQITNKLSTNNLVQPFQKEDSFKRHIEQNSTSNRSLSANIRSVDQINEQLDNNSKQMQIKMAKIFERQNAIYHNYKNKILETEFKKKEALEYSMHDQQKQVQDKLDKIYNEAAFLKNESKKMHSKILQLQILDKQKRTGGKII